MNIQKSINWCEKMKIPYNKIYNKFSEKPNIFLPIINDDLEVEDIETDEVENIIIIDNDI
jgi:hypothetical protein